MEWENWDFRPVFRPAFCGHSRSSEQTLSVRFVKKNTGGSPTGERVEAPQAVTCNTNTGVRIDPPGAQIDGDSGGQKIIGRVDPPPTPGKSDPADTTRSGTTRLTTQAESVDNFALLVFDPKHPYQLQWKPLQRSVKYTVTQGGKISDFRHKSPFISQTVKDRLCFLWNVNRKSQIDPRRSVPMILNDLGRRDVRDQNVHADLWLH